MNSQALPDLTLQRLADVRPFLEKEEYEELVDHLHAVAAKTVFFPTPKQQMVLDSTADIVGYGGAAGGGKSYLLTGLMTHHQRSAIVRPQKNQTKKFVQELQKMLRTRDGYSQQQSNWTFTTPDGLERYAEFFGLDNPGDEEKQQGVDFDLKGYDEATQMREEDIRYTLTWNRTDDPQQRVRAVLTFNPPTTQEGRWVIKFFAPWLDKSYPGTPAKDGELRWFATVGGNRDYEVAGPQQFVLRIVDGEERPWYNFNPADYEPEDIITPKSRTFIRAKVTDNPYYMKTGYLSQLQSLPEPLRSLMMKGDFDAFVRDDARQVIPSAWIEAAQARWTERNALYKSGAARKPPMDSIGADVARGGNMGGATDMPSQGDEMVVARRHGTFFDELKTAKGVDINDGAKSAAFIVGERRDEAPIHVDVIGVGTSTFDFLVANKLQTIAINGSAQAAGTDKSGMLKFFNKRAELHWRMREALDPGNTDPIALPPDPQLAADLAAPRWVLGKSGIQVETKDEIKKRLGRSPDRGDAVILANVDTPKRMMILGGIAGLPQESWEERRMRELEG